MEEFVVCVWIEDTDAIEMTDKSFVIVYQNERIKGLYV